MKTLAIRGDYERGKKVIKILEFFGGINKQNSSGSCTECIYYIRESDNEIVNTIYISSPENYYILSLNDFEKLYPFIPGDKVIVNSFKECGVDTIESIFRTVDGDIKYKTKNHKNTHFQTKDLTKAEYIEIKNCEQYLTINIPEGYELDSFINNEILLKKTETNSKYPTSFLDCFEILNLNDLEKPTAYGFMSIEFEALQQLIICRNAYWKIDDDWKPNFLDDELIKYCIVTWNDEVICDCCWQSNTILAFRTEEIRDAFYDNFKDKIEECKCLL